MYDYILYVSIYIIFYIGYNISVELFRFFFVNKMLILQPRFWGNI